MLKTNKVDQKHLINDTFSFSIMFCEHQELRNDRLGNTKDAKHALELNDGARSVKLALLKFRPAISHLKTFQFLKTSRSR